jgi:hypothetical protein
MQMRGAKVLDAYTGPVTCGVLRGSRGMAVYRLVSGSHLTISRLDGTQTLDQTGREWMDGRMSLVMNDG